MKFEIDRTKYIDTGLVDEKEHPTLPLLIYNYTQECQFSRAWDKVTIMCRGLIVNKDTREIVARPFKKFFNYEEHMANGDILPNEVPTVYSKFDGSLGILYWFDNIPYIATRGSFSSAQALWATKYIQENVPEIFSLDRTCTFLFEIIYPENRIVVSYGDTRDLILLACIDIETGKTIPMPFNSFSWAAPQEVPTLAYLDLKKLNTPNAEGFVVHYPKADIRVKIKFEDYIRLHKIMTGLSQIGIWENLRDGKDPFAQDIPDEMFNWVNGIVTKLKAEFADIEFHAQLTTDSARRCSTRREKAYLINFSKYPSISFAMLDGKDYKTPIWRMVRPKGAVTFKRDIDA